MRYIVETYAAKGCTVDKRPIEVRSLERARKECRERLGVAALRAERRHRPRLPGVVEAYRASLACDAGGVIIFRERGNASTGFRRRMGEVVEPASAATHVARLVFEPGERETEKRVQRAIAELGGSRRPVRLAELKKRLGSPEHAAFARVLRDLQDQELAILIREDNPPNITPEDSAAAVLIAGNPRHLVFLQ